MVQAEPVNTQLIEGEPAIPCLVSRAELARRVVELARIAVARRQGISDAEVSTALRSLGAGGRATMLEMPQFGVSSSAVRERAAAGRPLRYLVPEPVARFIEEMGIYS